MSQRATKHNEDSTMKNDHEIRITRIEAVIENINSNLADIKGDIKEFKSSIKSLEDKFDTKFQYLDDKFDSKFNILNQKIDTERAWIIGLGFVTMLSVFGSIVSILIKIGQI